MVRLRRTVWLHVWVLVGWLVVAVGPTAAEHAGLLGETVSLSTAQRPGGEVPVLRIVLPEGVHTYWRNPGDAGLAPTVSVDGVLLPMDRLHFPIPERFESSAVVGFGYSGVVELELPRSVARARTLQVRYLVCDAQRCLPGSADLDPSTLPPLPPLPREPHLLPPRVEVRVTVRGPVFEAVVPASALGGLTPGPIASATVFPYPPDMMQPAGVVLPLLLDGLACDVVDGGLRLTGRLRPGGWSEAVRVPVLIRLDPEAGEQARALEAELLWPPPSDAAD